MTNSPQLENGYTRLANEIMDQLCKFRIPGESRQVLDFIIRKTYGFNKKVDIISNSQIVGGTGLKKANVSRSLSELITHNLVIKNDNKLCLNKNYKNWISFKKLSKTITNKLLSKVITPVIKSDNNLLSKVMDTKDNKDNIQKTYPIIPKKTYFISLTENEKNKISQDLKVSLDVVNDYCEQADAWSNGKGNKMLNWYLTIRNWIQRDIKSGKVSIERTVEEQMNEVAIALGFDITKFQKHAAPNVKP